MNCTIRKFHRTLDKCPDPPGTRLDFHLLLELQLLYSFQTFTTGSSATQVASAGSPAYYCFLKLQLNFTTCTTLHLLYCCCSKLQFSYYLAQDTTVDNYLFLRLSWSYYWHFSYTKWSLPLLLVYQLTTCLAYYLHPSYTSWLNCKSLLLLDCQTTAWLLEDPLLLGTILQFDSTTSLPFESNINWGALPSLILIRGFSLIHRHDDSSLSFHYLCPCCCLQPCPCKCNATISWFSSFLGSSAKWMWW